MLKLRDKESPLPTGWGLPAAAAADALSPCLEAALPHAHMRAYMMAHMRDLRASVSMCALRSSVSCFFSPSCCSRTVSACGTPPRGTLPRQGPVRTPPAEGDLATQILLINSTLPR